VDPIDELLENNRAFAASQGPSQLAARPSRGVAIVTCMDARIDVIALLGLRPGEAHILRNAGAVVSEDVIRSLAISQRRLGTTEVMVIAHTNCGMQSVDEEGLRAELEEAAGVAPEFAVGAFADLEESVRESLRRIRSSPFLLDAVRGFVYDVETHRLREVEVPEATESAPAAH
jgi:carbonic anhydrase